MSPVDTRAARRPTHVGHDALTRLAVRLSWLYTLSAGVALAWVAIQDGAAAGLLGSLAVLGGFVVNALVVAQVCRSRSRAGIVAVTLTNAIAPAAAAVLATSQGWDGSGQLVAATAATAGGMGTALAIGPVLGLHTAFVALVFISVGTWLDGGTPSAQWLAGCATGTIVASVIGVLARRSFRIADAAIVGADDAAFAAEVSKRRWAARRAVDRQMHDTVLTTFSLLAHGDPKISPVDLREQAHRDIGVLAGDMSTPVTTPPSGLEPDGSSPTPLDELAESWRINGLKVSTHGTPWDEGVEGLGPIAVGMLLGAVRELLSNVARHADTESADITLSRTPDLLTAMVVDSGRGFDPSAVPPDRLGLAESVNGRVIDLGGTVTVFSRPGEGTTVVLGLPVDGESTVATATTGSAE